MTGYPDIKLSTRSDIWPDGLYPEKYLAVKMLKAGYLAGYLTN